jgi:hypothetical protein
MSIMFLFFRVREKRKLGAVVRDTTLELGGDKIIYSV